MHTKSDNITIMIDIETEDAINELFNTFRKRYQELSAFKGRSWRSLQINGLPKDFRQFFSEFGS